MAAFSSAHALYGGAHGAGLVRQACPAPQNLRSAFVGESVATPSHRPAQEAKAPGVAVRASAGAPVPRSHKLRSASAAALDQLRLSGGSRKSAALWTLEGVHARPVQARVLAGAVARSVSWAGWSSDASADSWLAQVSFVSKPASCQLAGVGPALVLVVPGLGYSSRPCLVFLVC